MIGAPERIRTTGRLWAERARWTFVLCMFAGIVCAGAWSYLTLGERGRANLGAYAKASYWAGVAPKRPITVTIDGEELRGEPAAFRDWLADDVYDGRSVTAMIRRFTLATSLGSGMALFGLFWVVRRRSTAAKETLRGPSLLDGPGLARAIAAKGEELGISVAGIPIPYRAEAQHFLVIGDVGKGKSVTLEHLLCQLEELSPNHDEPVVIYDPHREFTTRHYNPATDVLLNPEDERSPAWHLWDEIERPGDEIAIAHSIIPDTTSPSGSDAFFVDAAREVMAELLRSCHSMEELLGILQDENADFMRHLEGTRAAAIAGVGAAGQIAGVRGKLGVATRALARLKPVTDDCARWSAREWMADPHGWIFVTTTRVQRPALTPLMRLWIDLIAQRLLDRPVPQPPELPDPLWIVLEELPTLGPLATLVELILESRKVGGRILLCLQLVSDLRAVYGERWKSIVGPIATKTFFATGEPETAKWISDAIGGREHRIARENITVGDRDTLNFGDDTRIDALVLPSQIQYLPMLTAYLKHDNHVGLVSIPFPPERPSGDGYIPRTDDPVSPRRTAPPAPPTPTSTVAAALDAIHARAEANRAASQSESPDEERSPADLPPPMDYDDPFADFRVDPD